MPATAGVTHDISLTIGSTETGFMLARGQDGRKLWRVQSVDVVPDSFVTSQASLANVPAKVVIPVEQTAFYGGIGEYYFESGVKYNQASGVDASLPIGVMCAPQLIYEYQPTILNSSFESGAVGSPPPDWTCTGSPTTETTCCGGALGPLNGAKLCRLNPGDSIGQTWQAVAGGRQAMFNFKAGIGLTPGSSMTVEIITGSGSRSFSVTNPTVSAMWIERTFSHIVDLSQPLTIRFTYPAGSSYTAGVDYLEYLPPTRFCAHGGYYWLARGRFLERWSESNGWDFVPVDSTTFAFPAAITDLASYGTNLLIALGTSQPYYYGSASPFTASTSTSPNAVWFSVVGRYLWKSFGSSVYWTLDPTGVASWTGPYYVGDTSSDIVFLPDDPETAFVCKPNGLYVVDTSGNVSLYDTALTSDAAPDFGYNMCQWKGYRYLPCGTATLQELGTVITDISISRRAPDVSAARIQSKALAGDSGFLYVVGRQVGASSPYMWILRGSNLAISGEGESWRWHPLRRWSLPSDTIYDAVVYSGTPKKLFVATGDGVCYIHLPSVYSNPAFDADYRFSTDTDEDGLITPWLHCGYKLWDKAWHNVTLLTSGCSLGTYDHTITVYYRLTDDAAWTLLGTVDTSPSQRLSFPADCCGQKLQLRLKFLTEEAGATPRLLGFIVEAKLRPPSRRRFDVSIDLSDRVRLLNGVVVDQDVRSMRDILWSAFTSQWPVTLTDEFSTTYNVDVMDFTEYYDTDVIGDEPARLVKLTLMEALV